MKKMISLILTLSLLITVSCTIPASALDNNALSTAVEIAVDGSPVNDVLENKNSCNLYKFTLTDASNVKGLIISTTDKNYEVCFSLYKRVIYSYYDNYSFVIPTKNEIDTNGKTDYYVIDEVLLPGVYYIEIYYDILDTTNDSLEDNAPTYEISLNATTVDVQSAEPNNNFDTAQNLAENQIAYSSVNTDDTVDIFKITLPERKRVDIFTSGENYDDYYHRYLFDIEIYKNIPKSDSYEIVNKKQSFLEESAKHFSIDDNRWTRTQSFILEAGTYCLKFNSNCDPNDSAEFKLMYQTFEPDILFRNSKTGQLLLEKIKIKAGKTLRLSVTNGKVKKWISKNTKVLTVNQNGKITALTKGSTYVIAEMADGTTIRQRVTVKYSPYLSNGKKKIKSLTIGKSAPKKIYIKNKAKNIKYTVINKGKLKITGKRKNNYFYVKGIKNGKTTLKIKVNGVILKLKITVK